MADQTLYDVLEVNPDATTERIRDSFARLSAALDPDKPENAANAEARKQHAAIREAFLTLDNPEKRKRYDVELERKWAVLHNVEVVQPFWNLSKIVVIAIALAVGGGVYYGYSSMKREEARFAREKKEKAIAAAKAREEARLADIEAARAREEQKRQELAAMDEGQRQAHEAALKAEKCRLERQFQGWMVPC